MKRLLIGLILIGVILSSTGCRSMKYFAYEKVGVDKRDLLKKRVAAARDEEKKAQEEFKDALTKLQELTGFQGGDLEKFYRHLKSDYDDVAARVDKVHGRIDTMETVAGDLFKEWDKENRQIETDSLRQLSRRQLTDTRKRYEDMLAVLKETERKMDPTLRKLRDYVLALKHSLNAQAVASLRGESAKVETDINQLLEEMNTSIAEADKFIQHLPAENEGKQ